MDAHPHHIAHLDLDCFFVSVERVHDPSLNGVPAAVGGVGRRGVITSASYEARAFGVRSAMPTGRALQLCPHLRVVRGRHGEYGRISKHLTALLGDYAPVVEQASIDEMYLDLTGCERLYNGDLPGLMRTLKAVVKKEFSLPCTVALSSNKTVSKIATGVVKPDGLAVIPHGGEREFLAPLDISVIPGVGAKTEKELRKYDFHRILDLQRSTEETLVTLLGDHGRYIFRAANGRGSDRLEADWTRKSISTEETFGGDIADTTELQRRLFELTESVCYQTRRYGWRGRTVKLKLRYADFTTITRSVTLTEATADDKTVFDAALRLFRRAYDTRKPLRLLGVGLTQFTAAAEETLSIFGTDEKRNSALSAVDRLKKKFGDDAIHTGTV